MRFLLALGVLANILLASFLVADSGFVFGGPQGGRVQDSDVRAWSFSLAFCLIALVVGLVLQGRDRPRLGALILWAPTLTAMILLR